MPAAQTSSPASAPEPTPCWSHGGPSTVSIIGGSLVSPFGLLLSCTWFRRKIVQEPVPPGHRPSCGGGASSLLSELGTMPALLLSHSESSRIRCPPAFVPE